MSGWGRGNCVVPLRQYPRGRGLARSGWLERDDGGLRAELRSLCVRLDELERRVPEC